MKDTYLELELNGWWSPGTAEQVVELLLDHEQPLRAAILRQLGEAGDDDDRFLDVADIEKLRIKTALTMRLFRGDPRLVSVGLRFAPDESSRSTQLASVRVSVATGETSRQAWEIYRLLINNLVEHRPTAKGVSLLQISYPTASAWWRDDNSSSVEMFGEERRFPTIGRLGPYMTLPSEAMALLGGSETLRDCCQGALVERVESGLYAGSTMVNFAPGVDHRSDPVFDKAADLLAPVLPQQTGQLLPIVEASVASGNTIYWAANGRLLPNKFSQTARGLLAQIEDIYKNRKRKPRVLGSFPRDIQGLPTPQFRMWNKTIQWADAGVWDAELSDFLWGIAKPLGTVLPCVTMFDDWASRQGAQPERDFASLVLDAVDSYPAVVTTLRPGSGRRSYFDGFEVFFSADESVNFVLRDGKKWLGKQHADAIGAAIERAPGLFPGAQRWDPGSWGNAKTSLLNWLDILDMPHHPDADIPHWAPSE